MTFEGHLRINSRLMRSLRLSNSLRTSVSQAENAGSILVARSSLISLQRLTKSLQTLMLAFATIRHCLLPVRHRSLSQHCRDCDKGSKPRLALASRRLVPRRRTTPPAVAPSRDSSNAIIFQLRAAWRDE